LDQAAERPGWGGRRRALRACLWLGALWTAACAPSVEDQVEHLARGGQERDGAKQELLLAKDRAVGPLLAAMEDPRYAAARPELAEVLVSLMMRVDDERIEKALSQHLAADPDPRVRARIARQMGLYKRAGALEGLLQVLQDADGEVRYQALVALGVLAGKLSEAQRVRVDERARQLLDDSHPGVRMEAQIRMESTIAQWLEEARQLQLKAQLGAAEALYRRALDHLPGSRQTVYRLGRFYLDNGQRERGLALLRQHGMVLEVPRLAAAPRVNGRLDDPVWQQAAQADSFYQFSSAHKAALPSEVRTRLYVGYTPEALYVGVYARDEHPDSLIVEARERDGRVWFGDTIELFLDADFDHRSYVHLGINSAGAVADAWHREGMQDENLSWNAPIEVGTQVGADHWAMECMVGLGQKELPAPRPGTVWGANIVRVYRGAEYSQWVRT
jgi:HEAT repeat protein